MVKKVNEDPVCLSRNRPFFAETDDPKAVLTKITRLLTIHDAPDNLAETVTWIPAGEEAAKKLKTFDNKLLIDLQYNLVRNMHYVGTMEDRSLQLINDTIGRIKKERDHELWLAHSYVLKAKILNNLEKFREAKIFLGKAITALDTLKNSKAKKGMVIDYYSGMIDTLIGLHKYDDAKFFYEKVKKVPGRDPHDSAVLLFTYGTLLSATGDYKGALKIYREAYRTLREYLGFHHLDVVRCHLHIAVTYYYLEKYDRAVKIQQKRMKDFEKWLGTECLETAWAQSNLAKSLYCNEQYADALEVFYKHLGIIEKNADKIDVLWGYIWIALTLDKLNRHKESLGYFLKSIGLCKDTANTLSHHEIYKIYSHFAKYLYRRKKYKLLGKNIDPCVKIADGIISRGTKTAAALYYDPKIMDAPKITILGRNELAKAIIDSGIKNSIPVIPAPDLAAVLTDGFLPGKYIQPEQYRPVAEIYVQFRDRGSKGAAAACKEINGEQ